MIKLKPLDISVVKTAVNKGEIKFYTNNGNIYCSFANEYENGECVVVGKLEEMEERKHE